MDTVLAEAAGKIILKGSDHFVPPKEARMEFVLTYAGPLATNGSKVSDKHLIRRHFHKQLKRLWDVHPMLLNMPHGTIRAAPEILPTTPLKEGLARRFQSHGYSWVPLIRSELAMHCCLDFIILVPDGPGTVNRSGDLDNRVSILVDTLTLPQLNVTTGALGSPPTPEETPFFVLFADDSCVTRIVAEMATMLEPVNDAATFDQVRVMIKVILTPQYPTGVNMPFIGAR